MQMRSARGMCGATLVIASNSSCLVAFVSVASCWPLKLGSTQLPSTQVFGVGVRPLRMPEAVFDAMLDGWRVQQANRHLEPGTIKSRADVVHRAVRHVGEWPWEWTPAAVEEFIVDVASNGLTRSTIRGYQGHPEGVPGLRLRRPVSVGAL
jgi:hypothetical protein